MSEVTELKFCALTKGRNKQKTETKKRYFICKNNLGTDENKSIPKILSKDKEKR